MRKSTNVEITTKKTDRKMSVEIESDGTMTISVNREYRLNYIVIDRKEWIGIKKLVDETIEEHDKILDNLSRKNNENI